MNKTNIVIPMAGLGKRFSDCGYELPKPFLPLGNFTMIEAVVNNLIGVNGRNFSSPFYFTFIVNSKQLNIDDLTNKLNRILTPKDYQIVEVDYTPQGPAESALIGVVKTDIQSPLIITNCDQIIEDFTPELFNRFCEINNLDGAVGTFHSCSPKNSYVKLSDSNEVIDVKEKEVISNVATNGLHWWRKGLYFVESVNQMKRNKDVVNGEYYVAPSYNYMIQRGMKVMPYAFNMHYPIGTPKDYETYKKSRNL